MSLNEILLLDESRLTPRNGMNLEIQGINQALLRLVRIPGLRPKDTALLNFYMKTYERYNRDLFTKNEDVKRVLVNINEQIEEIKKQQLNRTPAQGNQETQETQGNQGNQETQGKKRSWWRKLTGRGRGKKRRSRKTRRRSQKTRRRARKTKKRRSSKRRNYR